MDFYETVYSRVSVRSYQAEPVPQEAIERMLEAARWAPSWCNKQCWNFVVVQDHEQVKKIRKATKVFAAPMYIIACGDPAQSGTKDDKPYYLVDVAIAMEHLVLAATAEGLGTCWMGWINEQKVREALGIPANQRVVALTPVGYPAEDLKSKVMNKVVDMAVKRGQRKSLAAMVHWEKW